MREVKLETIIISKEAWKFLRNKNRTMQGFTALNDEQLEKSWNRIRLKNLGANTKTYPIEENEIRIDRDCVSIRFELVKSILNNEGFSYREDGFIQEAIYC